MLAGLFEMGRVLLYVVALIVFIGAASHFLAWVLTRRHTAGWVWRFWNLLGGALLLGGLGAIGYGWLVLGLGTGFGSVLVGLGLLLASAGLWMIVPV